ncbi:MAG: hypothetical protein L6R42_006717 [Xanthoria sp. 1 TBL-2021]|nr:MAG: hypothetical protein L6R42_006717 [Xanthoria sp. 1 TBL-2021]
MARVKQFTEDASKTAIRVKQVAREGEVRDGKKSASNVWPGFSWLDEEQNADQSKLDDSAISPTAVRTFQSASTNCFSTGRHLRDDGVKEHDTKLRLRKPSLDLDATKGTTHAFIAGSESAPRDDDIKIHNTRSRSRSTGKSNNIVTPRDGKRSAVGKPPKKKDIASGTWQSSSSSFRSQGKPRQPRSSVTMEPELAIDGMYDLPSMLRNERFDCTLHQPFFLGFEYETLLISHEEKDAFMTNHSKLCSFLEDASHDLSHYYQHVNRFRELILQQPNTANAGSGSRSKTATGSQSHPPIQQMDNESVSSFISNWQKNYDTLITLGTEFAGDIDHYRHELRIFRIGVSEVREKTAGARQDVVNKWPFIRRFGHDVGLFRLEPPETREYHHALEVLDPWLTAILTKENLLALVWTNVTAIHEDLDAQVAARFSAGALSLFGPAASLSVQSWLTQIRQKAGS